MESWLDEGMDIHDVNDTPSPLSLARNSGPLQHHILLSIPIHTTRRMEYQKTGKWRIHDTDGLLQIIWTFYIDTWKE
jgi:hypothetical protein